MSYYHYNSIKIPDNSEYLHSWLIKTYKPDISDIELMSVWREYFGCDILDINTLYNTDNYEPCKYIDPNFLYRIYNIKINDPNFRQILDTVIYRTKNLNIKPVGECILI